MNAAALDDYLFTTRSFDEYAAMFALSDADLASGPILDCPSGGASFCAQARRRGARVTAVDPVFALESDAVVARARADHDRCEDHLQATIDQYAWTFFDTPDEHRQIRADALECFTDDFARFAADYMPVALPRLGFDDNRFALTLSSHFLFMYGDRLGIRFHFEAIRELARVTRGEVRIFPVVDYMGEPWADLKHLRRVLARERLRTELVEVEYEFQRGANQMLVVS